MHYEECFDKIMFVLLSLILFSCSQDDAVMNDHIVGTNESESEFLTLNSGVQVEKKVIIISSVEI